MRSFSWWACGFWGASEACGGLPRASGGPPGASGVPPGASGGPRGDFGGLDVGFGSGFRVFSGLPPYPCLVDPEISSFQATWRGGLASGPPE